MLERTLSSDYILGSNLKGDVAGANWTFLLPNLEIERVLCFGVPPITTLRTFSRIAQVVLVVCENSRQIDSVQQTIKQINLTNVDIVGADSQSILPLTADCIDLVFQISPYPINLSRTKITINNDIRRILKPEGLIYAEVRGKPVHNGRDFGKIMDFPGESQILWVSPIFGEIESAVPWKDRGTIQYFYHNGLDTHLLRQRAFTRVERFLSQFRLSSRFFQRFAVLIGRDAGHLADSPPRYLCKIAIDSGVDIDNHRWGLSAKGKYNTRKVLVFLYNRTSGTPEYIAKMTRDPAYNPRLENEHRSLLLLEEMGFGDKETLPRAVFFGYHSGLAIVGETVVDGNSFRSRTKTTADCPYALNAIHWLAELSAFTADFTTGTPQVIATVLRRIFFRFINIYQLDQKQRDFLESQIIRLGESSEGIPVVFQHGDPGTWNVRISEHGKAVFLDWEAAEPKGMPLWDLFYFLRSYCTWSANVRGVRNSLEGFVQQFMSESSLSSLVVNSVKEYCERINLPKNLVEPLFYTCWMHRALKEATRLSKDRLDRGHYVNLLRMSIDRRDAPTLQALFSLDKLHRSIN
jgi:hypothetical protein